MSIQCADGMDLFLDAADFANSPGWANPSGAGLTMGAAFGRFGAGGVKVSSATSVSNILIKTLPTAVAQGSILITSFAFKITQIDSVSATSPVMSWYDASGNVIGTLTYHANVGKLYLNDAGAGQAISGTAFTLNTWYWIEVKFISGTTTSNGTMQLRVNTGVVATISSANTKNTGSVTSISFGAGFGSSNVFAYYLDDIVINDDSGSLNQGYLGDLKIDTLLPTANGADTAWTSSSGTAHNDVDDPLNTPDQDSTYISANVVANKSSFTVGALSGTSAVIAVQARAKAKKADAGPRTINTYIKSSATEADDTAADPTTAYTWNKAQPHETDPNGSIGWTDTSVNALSIGVAIAT